MITQKCDECHVREAKIEVFVEGELEVLCKQCAEYFEKLKFLENQKLEES